MGLNCSRPVLDDQCTYYKPRHMYSLQHVDLVKLKKLIKAKRLSPCYPPMQDSGNEECPICNWEYPMLNTASCCAQRICTECFVQTQTTYKPPGKSPCPFCKANTFSVKFLGLKPPTQVANELRDNQIFEQAKLRQQQEQLVRDQERAIAAFQQQRSRQPMQQPPPVTGSSEDRLVSPAAAADVNAGRDSGSDGGSNSSVSDQQGERCWLSGAVGASFSDRPPAAGSRNLAVVDLYADATPADTTPPESSAGGSGGSSTSGGSSSGGAQRQQDGPQGQGQQQQQQQQQEQLQPQMAPHHVADELFDMGVLPGYVQQELAGLGVDELNIIMLEQALLASLRGAADAAAAAAAGAVVGHEMRSATSGLPASSTAAPAAQSSQLTAVGSQQAGCAAAGNDASHVASECLKCLSCDSTPSYQAGATGEMAATDLPGVECFPTAVSELYAAGDQSLSADAGTADCLASAEECSKVCQTVKERTVHQHQTQQQQQEEEQQTHQHQQWSVSSSNSATLWPTAAPLMQVLSWAAANGSPDPSVHTVTLFMVGSSNRGGGSSSGHLGGSRPPVPSQPCAAAPAASSPPLPAAAAVGPAGTSSGDELCSSGPSNHPGSPPQPVGQQQQQPPNTGQSSPQGKLGAATIDLLFPRGDAEEGDVSLSQQQQQQHQKRQQQADCGSTVVPECHPQQKQQQLAAAGEQQVVTAGGASLEVTGYVVAAWQVDEEGLGGPAASARLLLSEEQRQAQALAAAAARLVIVQHPDGSCALLSCPEGHTAGMTATAALAAAAVLPSSDWTDASDLDMQRCLAAADARLAARLATAAAAAAGAGDVSDAPTEPTPAAGPACDATANGAGSRGSSSSIAVVPCGAGQLHRAAHDEPTAAGDAPIDDSGADFAGRLRQLDAAYAAALQTRLAEQQ